MARRHAGCARAATHSSLSFAMALAERTRTRKAQAFGLSPLRRTSRAVRGGLPGRVKDPNLGSEAARFPLSGTEAVSHVTQAVVATSIDLRSARLERDGTGRQVFERLFESFFDHNDSARATSRGAPRSNPIRNVVPIFTCRAPP